jgi:hypothetical protein
MKTTVHYTLFNELISRRTLYWVLFFSPIATLWIYLASHRVVTAPSSDATGVISL